jgi:hypothetical protein
VGRTGASFARAPIQFSNSQTKKSLNVIASEAKQSIEQRERKRGLLRRLRSSMMTLEQSRCRPRERGDLYAVALVLEDADGELSRNR